MENKFAGMEVKAIIKKTRHKAELPLKYIAIAMTVIGMLIIGVLAEAVNQDASMKTALLEKLGTEDQMTTALVDGVLAFGIGCGIVVLIFFACTILFQYYKLYAQIMSAAVKVTPVNFPEIYAKAQEFTDKLGLKKVPEVYIQQHNGQLNAFATFVVGKRYVQLNAEMVDVAYMENKDFDTLYFVMAHEFGHIYFHHVTLLYNLATLVGRLIPIYGKTLIRAQEFSADRVAQALTDNVNSDKCMALLSGGRHLYKYIDINNYAESAEENHNFIERLGRFIINLLADHPITPFRVKAIMDPDRKSGRLI